MTTTPEVSHAEDLYDAHECIKDAVVRLIDTTKHARLVREALDELDALTTRLANRTQTGSLYISPSQVDLIRDHVTMLATTLDALSKAHADLRELTNPKPAES